MSSKTPPTDRPDADPPSDSASKETISVDGAVVGGAVDPRGTVEVNLDEILEPCLEELDRRGPVADPSELRALIPGLTGELRQFVLIELIKLDMALTAETGKPHPIEWYVQEFPDVILLDSIPLDLVLEEIQLRKEAGDSMSCDEYEQRFPQFKSVLPTLSDTTELTSAVQNLGAPPDLEAGRRIDDFLIVQLLGKGAFAHVYLARQLSMHRLVALKVSRGRGDEPQALAQFDHPNIVRVFDQRFVDDMQVHLLYMQFQPGGTLEDVVKSVRQSHSDRCGDVYLATVDQNLLSAAQVVPDRSSVREWFGSAEWPTVVAWIGMHLARALEEAHRMGVLHRDVKPANVLLSAEGIPKLADFNVSFAGAAGRAGASVCFGGSIGYMSPEHLRAISTKTRSSRDQVKEPADLYALAILLWELWQGHRPFAKGGRPAISWDDAVQQQLDSRSKPLNSPQRSGSAAERVLEKTLRLTLSHDIEDRPQSGAELAGRLRLALHPNAAKILDSGEQSFWRRLTNISPWIVVGLVILLPNIAAGIFNYEYNEHEVNLTDEMKQSLSMVATWVNSIAYPLAVGTMIWFARGLARGVRAAREGEAVSAADLRDTIELGNRAAIIGGGFWLVAGLIYPLVLRWMHADFTFMQMSHFFVSLLICGGVAMIYPFFGLALVSTLSYYPRLISGTMQDSGFDSRAARMIRQSEIYLLGAAIIPMLGAALIISSDSESKGFMLSAIAAGVVGLVAAFLVSRVIAKSWAQMGVILSKETPVLPGDGNAA